MSSNSLLIILIIAVVGIYILSVLLHGRHKRRGRMLRSLFVSEQDAAQTADELSAIGLLCRDLLAMVGVSVAENRKKNYSAYGKAGLYTEQVVSKFLFVRYFIQPIFMVIGIILVLKGATAADFTALDNLIALLVGFVLALFGLGGHTVVLDKLAVKRSQRLVQDFPDSVDLLLICVESGMGLDAALARVSRELQFSHPTVTAELERTRIERGLYGDRVQALQNLAERTDLQSYRSLVSALVQTERYGTNLAATLRTLSKEYRAARLLKAEEKAAKVGALLTLPVVLLVFFPVMALIMSPPFIQLFASGGIFTP